MSEPSDNAGSSRESTPRSQLRTPESQMSPSTPDQGAQDEYMPEVLKLSKSKGSEGLDRYFTDDEDGMHFRNIKEAVASLDHSKWRPPVNDATIPQNEEQERLIVRRLVEAFLDTSSAMDTEGNAYRKRLTPGTNVFYDPWTIERCAWEILHLVKSLHISGFKAPILDADILKAIGQTELWTFEDRIIMICRVLKISKSVAVSLMKHEKVWTTIGAPHKLYNSTIVNTQSNAFRNKWVKAGRAAEKGLAAPDNDGSPGIPGRKRRRAANTPPIRGSGTFAPSPLASGGSATPNTPTASAFSTSIGSSNNTPAAFTSTNGSSNNNNTPAAPTVFAITSTITPTNPTPTASANPTRNIIAQSSSTNAIRNAIAPSPSSVSAATDVEISHATPEPTPSKPVQEKVADNGTFYTASATAIKAERPSVDVTMDDAKPQRARADVDAAEMLLGLRKVS